MFNIGIDASGGDYGEIEVIKAVISQMKENVDICFYIYGDKDIIIECFDKQKFDYKNYRIRIVDAKEKISMNDHPVFSLRSKPNSSIMKASDSLKNNEIDVFISAGNTGALVALAQLYLKPIDGVDRPVVAALVPTKKKPLLIIDSGCNVDSKPEWLYQYAILSNIYAKKMYNIENPRIGLLSVGTEENKGNTLTLSAYKLLKGNSNINFIGNVEARDLPSGICDIVITDGFSGNVFLKTYEGTAKMLFSVFKHTFTDNILVMISLMIYISLMPIVIVLFLTHNMVIQGIIIFLLYFLSTILIITSLLKIFKKFDAKIYGGAPILGANYLVIKCHGNAKSTEYTYAIKQAITFIKNDLIKNMRIEV